MLSAILGAIELARQLQPGVTELVLAINRPSGGIDVVGTLDIAEQRTLDNIETKKALIEKLKADMAAEDEG